MKKTKIILPAIALLAISGAASVTGTVAWFTAASRKSFELTNVVAVSTSGNLDVTFSGASGCEVTTDGESIALKDLRDASVNLTATTPEVYTANFLDGAVNSYTKVEDPTVKAFSTKVNKIDNVHVFYCAMFTGTFSLGGVASDSYALMFDGRKAYSNLDSDTATVPTETNVYKALRVGMIGADKTIVYAPWAGTTATYVKGTTTADTGTYNTINITNVTTAVADAQETATTIADNSTLLDAGIAGGTTSAVKFYVWFEGSDSNCLSSAEGVSTAEKLVAKTLNLTFYAARLK